MAHLIDPSRKSGREIQGMFASIAPRYDRLNRLLSAGLDRRWRRVTVDRVLGEDAPAGLKVLDLCCGTGDLALEFAGDPRVVEVTGVDFVEAMVQRAQHKAASSPSNGVRFKWIVGDALRLPVIDQRFDVASIAFGLRNLVDPADGLRAIAQTLRPGGRLAVLEFFRPPAGILSGFFRLYFRQVLPRFGRWLSRSREFDAYRYLPDSVDSFVKPDDVAAWLKQVGFRRVKVEPLTIGAVALITGLDWAGSSECRIEHTQETTEGNRDPSSSKRWESVQWSTA